MQPVTLQPEPDPSFVRELKKIDPALRVVWGYERYYKRSWVIERRMTPERYWQCYASLFEEGLARFVKQPIYDHDQPIYDNEGELIDWTIIGYRDFDLAPEWEWLHTIETLDGQFKPLGADDLLKLRREYAWNINHPLSRHRFEEEQRLKDESKDRDFKKKISDLIMESVEQAWYEHDKIVTHNVGPTRMEGTEV